MASSNNNPVLNLTPQQVKWFAAVKRGLEEETGKSFEDWVEIARTCPEKKVRARTGWFKENHNIGLNRASVILAEAFDDFPSWKDARKLKEALWKEPAHLEILEALEEKVSELEGCATVYRKTFVAFSRKVQFAAARPYKGQVRIGIAVQPSEDKRLETPLKSEGWSDRLKASMVLNNMNEIDDSLVSLLKQAWEAA